MLCKWHNCVVERFSNFSHLLNQLKGGRRWPQHIATVQGCEWHKGGAITSSGTYRVAYSYQVNGQIYTGSFKQLAGKEERSGFDLNDRIDIRAKPEDPRLSYYEPAADEAFSEAIYGVLALILLLTFLVLPPHSILGIF